MIAAAGGALVDVRARAASRWTPRRSLPGTVRLVPGGAARNVAADLVRLGHGTVLLTAVGDDPLGQWVLDQAEAAGVDMAAALRRRGPTGVYVAVGPKSGPAWCVSDAGVIEGLTPADVQAWYEILGGSRAVVCDANFTAETVQAIAMMASGQPRVLLATSPDKVSRLEAVLSGAVVLVCNRREALALTGLRGDATWRTLGATIIARGVERVVLTHGPRGVAVMTRDDAAWAPALGVPAVDPTGAGDAVAAVAVAALLRGLSPAETARLAARAAAVVVQSEQNTPETLSGVLT